MMKLSSIYIKAFEQDCIELIIYAYSVARTEKKYMNNWHENDFSELLVHYINESTISLKKKITCKTENKLLSESNNQVKGFADKLPRIDFVYFKIWKNERFHCYMEAKRLKEKDSDLKRAYINEGMDRFISNKYPIGVMLGYLLEGDLNKIVNGINSLIEKDSRENETLNHKQHKLHKNYYESNHPDIGILKHLILNFTLIF